MFEFLERLDGGAQTKVDGLGESDAVVDLALDPVIDVLVRVL